MDIRFKKSAIEWHQNIFQSWEEGGSSPPFLKGETTSYHSSHRIAFGKKLTMKLHLTNEKALMTTKKLIIVVCSCIRRWRDKLNGQ